MPVPDYGKWAQAWIQEKGGPEQSSKAAIIEDWKEGNRNTRVTLSKIAYKGGYLHLYRDIPLFARAKYIQKSLKVP